MISRGFGEEMSLEFMMLKVFVYVFVGEGLLEI